MDGTREDTNATSRSLLRLKELLLETERQRLDQLAGEVRHLAGVTRAGEDGLARRIETSEQSTRALIEELRTRLEPVYATAGTREHLCKSVAGILDEALREAEVERHAELSQALAPLLVKTIKTEIVNSRDEMVEALYPITGRLVKAYVANAVKDMMVDINRRLEIGMPGRRAMLRMRSVLTGRSPAELALAESQRLEVVELLLIRRGSGELVANWDRTPDASPAAGGVAATTGSARPRGNGGREALVGGLLSAITSFAETAFESEPESLRRLERESDAIYLRATPAFILAARCRGTAQTPIEQLVDNELVATLARHGSLLARSGGDASGIEGAPVARVLPELAGRLDLGIAERQAAQVAERGGFGSLITLVVLLLLPLLGWIAWQAYGTWETNRVRQAARGVVTSTSELRGYPIHITVERRGRHVLVTGLAPSEEFRRNLQQRIAAVAPEAEVQVELAVLPQVTSVDHAPAIARVADEAREAAAAEGRRAAVALEAERRRFDDALAELARRQQTALAATEAGARDDANRAREAATAALEAERRRLEAALAEQASRQQTELTVTRSATRDIVARTREETAARLLAIEQALASFGAGSPVPVLVTPRERLLAWGRENAIFFGDGASYRDTSTAERQLAELAALIVATEGPVRIAGYTDERGGQARNAPLAQSRAQRVVDDLVARGVPRERLVAIGRASGPDLSPDIGPTSPNRRVEVELAFRGEAGGRP